MINGNGSSSHSMDTAIDNSEHSLSDKAPSSPRPGANRRGSKSGKRRTGNYLLNDQVFIDILRVKVFIKLKKKLIKQFQ